MGAAPVIAPSARKHGVTDQDMLHAHANPIRVFDLDDGLTMLVGGDVVGNLYEVGVVEAATESVIVHAMPARAKFLR